MKRLETLSRRQRAILEVLGNLPRAGVSTVILKVAERFDRASRITIIRDLNSLLKKKLISRTGEGRAITYALRIPFLLRIFDTETYFSDGPDQRLIQKECFNFSPNTYWEMLLDETEKASIHRQTHDYRKHAKAYTGAMLQKELERVTIEFSWKSSQLEGNTYTLLDTERLIREQRKTKGKKPEEAMMIINHKIALGYAWEHAKSFRHITVRSIEELHDMIVNGLGIQKGLRKHPVGIIGTAYKPYDNVFQIREALEDLCHLINALKEPWLKALAAVAGLSYIQPFEDGNKRTSRLLGNALLLAHNSCPLSYRSVDEIEYKKALILFYEQHTLFAFKKIFLEQYSFAVENYFT